MTAADASGLPMDHPLARENGPANMREAINERVASQAVVTGARADLADATRTIIDELMRSTADDAEFVQAAGLVVQAAQLLREQAHGRSYEGVAEASLSDGASKFIDFSPFIGVLNPLAPPLSVRFDEDRTVIGTCTYGAAYEGPPGCLHGGFIAAAFDEILGFAQAYSGRPGMTGNLNISYRSPTPLFREVTFVGRLDRVEGRKIFASATLSDGDRLCAQAEGLFISMKPAVFERLMQLRVNPGEDPPTTPRVSSPAPD
ncbi:MAG: hypothetical protein JWN62_4590 [Acidimicrobiales bacterium]|nr:hypothetical protein [Acidimicrobiales bacterium]